MATKILIVDDDQDIRQGLIIRLRASHYETAWASDAISAISIAQKEKPDLILLDIGLPGGDGFLVMERLKTMVGSTPVIVLSARDPMLNKERALKAGARAFLQKPVDNCQLLEAIGQCTQSEHADGQESTGCKILIVDDDQDIRQGLIIRLRASHYETIWASDAISAISIAQKEKPDLILLDIGLPGGDGFLVMERLKSMVGCLPVIVLSARDPMLNKERALNSGAFAFLQKPVDNDQLLETIQTALEMFQGVPADPRIRPEPVPAMWNS